jgi:hypothetical protein
VRDFIQDHELVIDGTTLVWRTRVSYASPEIRRAILSGTGGFLEHTVGQWEEHNRVQIIGREAHYSRVDSGELEESIYIISEDGNIITDNTTRGGKTYTSIFRRE